MVDAFLFDLDGTLTSVELLPLIARELGLEAEIRQITDDTVAGKRSFDESFRMRVELLGSVPVERVAEIVRNVPVHEELMAWIQENRSRVWIVTGNLDCWVKGWLDQHDLASYTSTAQIVDGKVQVDKILRKESVLVDFEGLTTVMVGDGANDAQLIADATVGVGAALVHPVPRVVMEVADFIAMEEVTLCRTLQRLS